MISNPFVLLSVLISALIAFSTVVLIVESSIVLFKIKPGRVRSVLRLLPFISLFVDLFFEYFSFGYWLNPLNCSSCIQKLLLNLFFPELKSYLYTNEISLLRYLGTEASHPLFALVFLTFFMIIFYFILRKLIEGILLIRWLKALIVSESPCTRSITNPLLSAAVQKSQARLFSTDKTQTPMAGYFKTIFIPKNIIETFPQDEFEAIIAHELEHLLWRDPIVKLYSQLMSAIFWWLPIASWQKKMEFEQEVACDQGIKKYGMKDEFLASALVKVATANKEQMSEAFCYLNNEKHPVLKRLQIMVGHHSAYSKRIEFVCCVVVATALVIGVVCTAWSG